VTNDDLQQALAFYQPLLRLADWRIEVSFVHHHDLPETAVAASQIFEPERRSRIAILAEAEYDPDNQAKMDSEHSLVHELIHLHLELWRVEDNTPQWMQKEQAINMLAEALVTLRRQGGAAWRNGSGETLPVTGNIPFLLGITPHSLRDSNSAS
jgi:hypothetical protein